MLIKRNNSSEWLEVVLDKDILIFEHIPLGQILASIRFHSQFQNTGSTGDNFLAKDGPNEHFSMMLYPLIVRETLLSGFVRVHLCSTYLPVK